MVVESHQKLSFCEHFKMIISSDTLEITFENIQMLIEEAIKIDACDDNIQILKSLKTTDEFINHPDAPYWCFWVADNLLNKRWKEAEYIIARDFSCACEYASYIIGERWDAVENNLHLVSKNNIRDSAGSCYYYAKDCIRGRWEKAEPIILQSLFFSSFYAIDVLKHKWDLLDNVINSYSDEEFEKIEYNDKMAINLYLKSF